MHNEYDTSLHSPRQYRTMQSQARELDEVATDNAIAGLLSDSEEVEPDGVPKEPQQRSEFPTLTPQDSSAEDSEPRETGVAAILRQTWAHLSGAA